MSKKTSEHANPAKTGEREGEDRDFAHGPLAHCAYTPKDFLAFLPSPSLKENTVQKRLLDPLFKGGGGKRKIDWQGQGFCLIS